MEAVSVENESPVTTGEDIGKITWPRVAALPGHVPDEFDSQHHHGLSERPGAFRGVYEFSRRGLTGVLRAVDSTTGMLALDLQLHFPANCAHTGELRTLQLFAEVRESWVGEASRGATSRPEQGERLVGALAALAMIPGQKTVTVVESGVSVHEAVPALGAALSAGFAAG